MVRSCKLKGNYCEVMDTYISDHVLEIFCVTCLRYPGGPEEYKNNKKRKVGYELFDKVSKLESEYGSKFKLICEECSEVCYYRGKPCMVGKVGTECPQGKWKALTYEDFISMKKEESGDE